MNTFNERFQDLSKEALTFIEKSINEAQENRIRFVGDPDEIAEPDWLNQLWEAPLYWDVTRYSSHREYGITELYKEDDMYLALMHEKGDDDDDERPKTLTLYTLHDDTIIEIATAIQEGRIY